MRCAMENMVSQDDRTISVHMEHEFLLKMEKAGLDGELAQVVVGSKDNELAGKMVELVRNRGFSATTSQKLVRAILGKNFFGVEEAIKHFGVNPTKQQLAFLAEVPFNEAVLQECKDSHILVAVFPMSVLDIRGKVERKLFYSHEDSWYNKQAFAKRGEIGWHLVKKTPVNNSTYKFWSEQQTLLAKNEETPKVQVMTYTIIGHYLSTSERLFQNVYVRTSAVASGGGHVSLGNFGELGLRIFSWSDVDRYNYIGLASARKSSWSKTRTSNSWTLDRCETDKGSSFWN